MLNPNKLCGAGCNEIKLSEEYSGSPIRFGGVASNRLGNETSQGVVQQDHLSALN